MIVETFCPKKSVITKGDNFTKTNFAVTPVTQNSYLTH